MGVLIDAYDELEFTDILSDAYDRLDEDTELFIAEYENLDEVMGVLIDAYDELEFTDVLSDAYDRLDEDTELFIAEYKNLDEVIGGLNGAYGRLDELIAALNTDIGVLRDVYAELDEVTEALLAEDNLDEVTGVFSAVPTEEDILDLKKLKLFDEDIEEDETLLDMDVGSDACGSRVDPKQVELEDEGFIAILEVDVYRSMSELRPVCKDVSVKYELGGTRELSPGPEYVTLVLIIDGIGGGIDLTLRPPDVEETEMEEEELVTREHLDEASDVDVTGTALEFVCKDVLQLMAGIATKDVVE
ncbi:hypothetical protein M8J77_014050 [Diaphorina citri]|nr:hypothetical protein M8J77_014050 [Diaphorina citri]